MHEMITAQNLASYARYANNSVQSAIVIGEKCDHNTQQRQHDHEPAKHQQEAATFSQTTTPATTCFLHTNICQSRQPDDGGELSEEVSQLSYYNGVGKLQSHTANWNLCISRK